MAIVRVGDCVVCSSQAFRPFWTPDLLRCASCALVRAADRHFEIDPSALYGEKYYAGADSEYVDYRGEREAVRRNSARRMRLIERLAPRARTLFEIGCGYGYFLEAAAEHWSVSGIEVSAYASREAQNAGLPCACGDYLALARSERPADIVCMWDTIEHLLEPRKVLEKIAAELPPDGLLAMSTGDIGSWLPRLQRGRWRLIHPPTHLWYFSVDTLTRLLRRCGLIAVRVVHPAFYRSLRFYLRPFARYIPARIGDWPIPLQTGDLMEIYARPASAADGIGCEPVRL